MKSITLILKINLIFLSCISFQLSANVLSLCGTNESIIFSCQTQRNIISLCALNKSSSTSAQIKYKYGNLNKTEFIYPESKAAKSSLFSREFTKWDNGSSSLLINFHNGKYDYTIYSDVVIGETEAMNEDKKGEYGYHAGIKVSRNGTELSDIKCNDNLPSESEPWIVNKRLEPLVPLLN